MHCMCSLGYGVWKSDASCAVVEHLLCLQSCSRVLPTAEGPAGAWVPQSHWTQLGQTASQESPHRQVCTPCQQLALDGSGTPPTKRADLVHFKVVSFWESDTYQRSTKKPVISSSRLCLAELHLKLNYQTYIYVIDTGTACDCKISRLCHNLFFEIYLHSRVAKLYN